MGLMVAATVSGPSRIDDFGSCFLEERHSDLVLGNLMCSDIFKACSFLCATNLITETAFGNAMLQSDIVRALAVASLPFTFTKGEVGKAGLFAVYFINVYNVVV